MPSVQELLAVLEADKSPFISLMEGVAGGYANAQQNRIENAKRLMEIEKMRQEQEQRKQQMEQQKQMQDAIKKQMEDQTQSGLKSTGTTSPSLPIQKFETEISQDEKGLYSRKFKTVDVTPKEPASLDALAAEKVRKGEMTLDEAFRMKEKTPAPPPPDRSMQRAVTTAKVNLAQTRPMVDAVTKEIERVEALNPESYGGKIGALKMKAMSATEVGTDSAKFKNTSDVVNTMQAQVAKVLKSTFGGQLSDGEREYLNGVYGALPSLSRSERAIAMKNVKTMLKAKLAGDESTLNSLLDDAGIAQNGIGSTTPKTTTNAGCDGQWTSESEARYQELLRKRGGK